MMKTVLMACLSAVTIWVMYQILKLVASAMIKKEEPRNNEIPPLPWEIKEDTSTEIDALLPYRRNPYLLDRYEKNFYPVVMEWANKNGLIVFPKLRVADLFDVTEKGSRKRYFTYLNKIIQKHVDFTICLPNRFIPVFAIELDGSSHKRPDRIENDEFKNRLFAEQNFPLIRIEIKNTYDKTEIFARFDDVLKQLSTCQKCGKAVDSNVRSYCLANTGVFGGNVYCYEHQKDLKRAL